MKSAVAPATTILNIGDLLEVVTPGTHKQNDRTLEGCVDLGQRGLRMGSADGRDVTHQVMLMIERLTPQYGRFCAKGDISQVSPLSRSTKRKIRLAAVSPKSDQVF